MLTAEMHGYNATIRSSQAVQKKKTTKKPNKKSDVDKQIEAEILCDHTEADEEVPPLPPPLH